MLGKLFPGLADGDYRVTSPPDGKYNCIAWAARDTQNWWWPSAYTVTEYWPEAAPREVTLNAFSAAFATLGYDITESSTLEDRFEHIAIFADAQRNPTHAARQLPNGRWTSKLGKTQDIEHDLHDLEGTIYGKVALIMRRPMSG